MKRNVAALCCYAGWFITGIIFLVREGRDKVVRFHALQSILWFLALAVIHTAVWLFTAVFGWVPFVGELVTGITQLVFNVVWFGSWLFLMLAAYRGRMFKIPIIGEAAERQIGKM
jgi:uncharacterized membrane protein